MRGFTRKQVDRTNLLIGRGTLGQINERTENAEFGVSPKFFGCPWKERIRILGSRPNSRIADKIEIGQNLKIKSLAEIADRRYILKEGQLSTSDITSVQQKEQ